MWNKIISCLLLFVISSVAVASEDVKTEDGVLVLTEANFKSIIDSYQFVLVEFYAPWCKHCKDLAPKYAMIADIFAKENPDIKIAKVDATEEQDLAEKYRVRGYPTLKLFINGEPTDYNDNRSVENIVAWLKKKTGPPATTLENVEQVEKFVEDDKIKVVGFFKDLESKEAKAFLTTATTNDEFEFGITSNDEVFDKYEVKDGQVILFKPFDEKKTVFDEETTVDNLKKFIGTYSLPLIVDFNHDSARKIFGGDIKSHLLFFVSKAANHIENHVEPAKDVAKKFRNEVVFVTIDADVEEHQRIFEFFGIKTDEVPSLRLIKLEDDMAKYKPETDDLSKENIEEFVQKFLDGKLKQHLLSQPLPKDWNDNPVKVLVASNFDEITLNKDVDVLVEFYAPWCGHCQQLAPIYNELAEKYKDNASIVIAKIDATANELEHTKILQFPTIKLYRKGDNEVIDYNSDRTLEGLTKFLEAGGKIEEEAPVVDTDEVTDLPDEEEEKKPEKDEL